MTDPTGHERTATPLSQSVELALANQPDVKNKYGSGRIRPTVIVFYYLSDRINAHLHGVWVREDGELTDAPVDQDYRYDAEWPGWLTEMARAHRPAAAPATDRAAPVDWIDGHPQLEAIAAAVWEHCRTEGTSLVVDDPRNIAVAALAAVLSASVDRATLLREEAALIRAHCPDHLDADSAEGSWMDCHCPVADDMERRATDETPGEPTDADVVEAHRLALSFALGLGTGAPWDAIRDRAVDLREAEQPAVGAQQEERP